MARLAASSAATWAAYGVDFLAPLKPTEPPDVHTIVSPFGSVILIMVLLKLAFMWATALDIVFLFFFLDLCLFSTTT